MIWEPPLSGAIHRTKTFSPLITVVGATGYAGIWAARIENDVDRALRPTEFAD